MAFAPVATNAIFEMFGNAFPATHRQLDNIAFALEDWIGDLYRWLGDDMPHTLNTRGVNVLRVLPIGLVLSGTSLSLNDANWRLSRRRHCCATQGNCPLRDAPVDIFGLDAQYR